MMGLRNSARGITASSLSRIVFITMFISALPGNVRGDGGTVLCQRTTGPHLVTALTTQSPLRKGQTDISVLVERTGDPRPVLDAQVFIELVNEVGVTVGAEATHTQARNKLLYCSLMNIPAAGRWTMKIVVKHGGERVEMLDHLVVAEAQPMLLAYWKLIAIPPVIIILFIINQWLVRNRWTTDVQLKN